MGQRLTKQMLSLLTITFECSENKMVQHVHIDYALLHVWVELLKYEKPDAHGPGYCINVEFTTSKRIIEVSQ